MMRTYVANKQRQKRADWDGRTVRKRCAKCGKRGYYKAEERHCRHYVRIGFGTFANRYLCWGALERVVRKQQPKEEPLKHTNDVDDAALMRHRATVRRDAAQKKLDAVNARIGALTRDIAKRSKKLRTLTATAARLSRRVTMTDEQFEAERVRTVESFKSKRKPRRAVAFEKVAP